MERHFKNLDFERALEKEKKVANRSSLDDWLEPLGTVAIVCEAQSTLLLNDDLFADPLNFAISPLAAAIAAGNCAILLTLPSFTSETSQLLRELCSTLDNDAYAMAECASESDIWDLMNGDIQCLIHPSSPRKPREGTEVQILQSGPIASCAIVDRSCTDLRVAATRIAQVKFLYGSASPFSPSLVLVHEVVKAAFLRELIAAISQYSPEDIAITDKKRFNDALATISKAEANVGRVVLSGGSGYVEKDSVAPILVDASRESGVRLCELAKGIPLLPAFSTRSLDDAIDLSGSL